MSFRRLAPMLALLFLGVTPSCDYVRTEADCAADARAMQDEVSMAYEQATACQEDADCVALDVSNQCYGACPVAVHRADVAFVTKSIEEAESALCLGYMEQCGYTTPLCPARTPMCVQGRCEMVEPLSVYLVAPTL